MTYALIAILAGNAYVLDSGLTLRDCGVAIASIPAIAETPLGSHIDLAGATFACEVEP
jgi:hypothetical protein